MATLGSTSCWKILHNLSVFCPQLLHFSTFPNESWNKQNPHVNCLSYQKINKFDRLFSEILANISAPTYVGHPVYHVGLSREVGGNRHTGAWLLNRSCEQLACTLGYDADQKVIPQPRNSRGNNSRRREEILFFRPLVIRGLGTRLRDGGHRWKFLFISWIYSPGTSFWLTYHQPPIWECLSACWGTWTFQQSRIYRNESNKICNDFW